MISKKMYPYCLVSAILLWIGSTCAFAQTADLSIWASADQYPVKLGNPLTYTISVYSYGPDTASNVVVQNTLPKGATFVSSNPACNYDVLTGICEWNVGTLTSGFTETFTVTIQADFPTTDGIIDLYFTGIYDSDPNLTPGVMRIPLGRGPLEFVDGFINATSVKGMDFLSDGYAIGIDAGQPGIPASPYDGGVYHLFWGWISAGQYLVNPTGIEVDASDNIYIVDPDWVSGTPSGRIVRTHLDHGIQSLVSDGQFFVNPVDLVLLDTGGELAVCDLSRKVILVSMIDGSQILLSSGGELVEPWGITQEPSGNFIVADRQKGLIRVDRYTGAQSIVSGVGGTSGLTAPNSVDCGFDGRLYVSDDSNKVVIVNATSGAVETTYDGVPLLFENPKGLSLRHFYLNRAQVSSTTTDPTPSNNAFEDLSEVKKEYPMHLVFGDTVSVSDQTFIGPPESLVINEGVSVSDSAQVGSPAHLIINELIAVAELVKLGFPHVLLINELIQLAELVDVSLAPQSGHQEQVAVSDQLMLHLSNVPPTVASTITQSGHIEILPGSGVDPAVSGIRIWFNKRLNDPPGDTDLNDVTNPDNYLLVKSSNGLALQTQSCVQGVQPGDTQIPIHSVNYNNTGPYVTIFVDSETALSKGAYRLLVCGSTSIMDESNQKLDGNGDGLAGDDMQLDFEILQTNLLKNPNFDLDLSLWNTDGYLLFSTADADSFSDTSGSATCALDKGEFSHFSQCVNVVADNWFRAKGAVRYNGDMPKDVSIQAMVTWFSGPDCTGMNLDQLVIPVITADTGSGWVHFEKTIQPPLLTHSAKFELKTQSNAQTSQTVFWDNLGLYDDESLIRIEDFDEGILPIW